MTKDPGDPRHPQTFVREGDAARKQGDIARAVAAYERAGMLYESISQHLKALAVWKVLLALAPDRLDLRLRLADCFAVLGLNDQAIREFRAVVDRSSTLETKDLHDRATKGLYNLVPS